MTATLQDVADRANRDLGAEFAQYNFVDDVTFQEYVLELSTEVSGAQAVRVGDLYTLDNAALFDAAVLETMSRMAQRILAQFYGNVLSTESITIGPIQLQQGRNESVSKDIRDYVQMLHLEAEAALARFGAPSRKGAIKVWVPRNRITVI